MVVACQTRYFLSLCKLVCTSQAFFTLLDVEHLRLYFDTTNRAVLSFGGPVGDFWCAALCGVPRVCVMVLHVRDGGLDTP